MAVSAVKTVASAQVVGSAFVTVRGLNGEAEYVMIPEPEESTALSPQIGPTNPKVNPTMGAISVAGWPLEDSRDGMFIGDDGYAVPFTNH